MLLFVACLSVMATLIQASSMPVNCARYHTFTSKNLRVDWYFVLPQVLLSIDCVSLNFAASNTYPSEQCAIQNCNRATTSHCYIINHHQPIPSIANTQIQRWRVPYHQNINCKPQITKTSYPPKVDCCMLFWLILVVCQDLGRILSLLLVDDVCGTILTRAQKE